MSRFFSAFLAATALGVLSAPAFAVMEDNAGRILLRGRAIAVVPDEGASIDPIGGTVSIDTATVPELDLSYFFTNNIAVEVIAAVTPHDVTAKDTALGGVDVGSVWLLPPTVTLQYHFTSLPVAKPYVGVGLNYTHFYDADPGDLARVKYDDSFGPAVQAGVDVPLTGNWVFNVDVKKIWINTTAKFNDGAVSADVDINPWIVGVGFGYRF